MSSQSKRQKALMSAVAVLLFAGLLEGGLRLAGFQYEGFLGRASWWSRWDDKRYLADPALFWVLRPSTEHKPEQPGYMSVNSLGFRSEEFAAKKPQGSYRIVTLGDSCTFGDGVSNRQTYAAVTQELLRKDFPGRKIEVINAGVPGYTSYQVLKLFETKVRGLSPDAITVYVGINDGIPIPRGRSDAQRGRKNARAMWIRGRLGHLRTYRFLQFLLLGPGAPAMDASAPTLRVAREELMDNLRRLYEGCVRQKITMLLLTNPSRGRPESENGANAILREVSRREGVSLIDLYRAFKPLEEEGEELYDAPGGHPAPEGHRLIGRLVAKWFAGRIL